MSRVRQILTACHHPVERPPAQRGAADQPGSDYLVDSMIGNER
jgi:hypothetical protein